MMLGGQLDDAEHHPGGVTLRLKVGQTLVSATDSTTVVVIRAPERDVLITCGGVQMTAGASSGVSTATPIPGSANGTSLGKRYEDTDGTIELLCTKAGSGSLALDDAPLAIKAAKPLPASD